jgi:hypothetical protein
MTGEPPAGEAAANHLICGPHIPTPAKALLDEVSSNLMQRRIKRICVCAGPDRGAVKSSVVMKRFLPD